LDDLSPFRAVPANWRVAGGAESDPLVREHLSATPGTGVLVNQPAPAVGENLFTVMEHGDVELELEFLMLAASNSGVYLQGRHEIQLRDSWGVENPGFGYTGGVYERFGESGSRSGSSSRRPASMPAGGKRITPGFSGWRTTACSSRKTSR
jgi:hypothetical protein